MFKQLAQYTMLMLMALPILANAVEDGAEESRPGPVQVIAPEVEARTIEESDIDTEFFEVGLFAGFLSIDNFSSEPMYGLNASFHATEDFFIQFNYGQASAGLTSFEELSGTNVRLVSDDDRDYIYYDFLLGYNIFPGEIFFTDQLAFNSAIYLVGGVGNTDFGGENNFTTIAGTGYRIIFNDWLAWHVDFRDHMFKSDLIRQSQLTHNIEISSGITLFF
ncbi:outer membrane beta-barrel domain-containing protein [Hahella ganghwensis]|uniref:outer membrane beta-barrel domain-containing protein n=1 Tax=Hahella ganghwensis TaxID=286420 RepID=UPI0003A4C69F|nr:outer membrane beta-barrel domain-containing protein [Hahella ganghwensis]